MTQLKNIEDYIKVLKSYEIHLDVVIDDFSNFETVSMATRNKYEIWSTLAKIKSEDNLNQTEKGHLDLDSLSEKVHQLEKQNKEVIFKLKM